MVLKKEIKNLEIEIQSQVLEKKNPLMAGYHEECEVKYYLKQDLLKDEKYNELDKNLKVKQGFLEKLNNYLTNGKRVVGWSDLSD